MFTDKIATKMDVLLNMAKAFVMSQSNIRGCLSKAGDSFNNGRIVL